MPLTLCLSGCMCHKQSAFCYRFSMLSTEKCECPYFVWKWARWLQGAVTKGNCFSCKIIDLKFSFAGWKCNGSIELQWGYLGLTSNKGESIKDTCKASVSTTSSALIDQIFQQYLEHLVSKYVQSLSWPVCFAHRSRLMFSHAFQTVQHAGETW